MSETERDAIETLRSFRGTFAGHGRRASEGELAEFDAALESLRTALSTAQARERELEAELGRLRIAYSDSREARARHAWLEHGEVLQTPSEVAGIAALQAENRELREELAASTGTDQPDMLTLPAPYPQRESDSPTPRM